MTGAHPLAQMGEQRTPLWCAQALANRGWPVFPLAPGSKQPLSAMAPNGFHSASTDPEQIRRWWTARPDAGVGLALKDSGLVCVDVDPRNGGLETLERLEAQHGPMQSDVMAYTPGGGMHFLFSAQLVGNLPGTLGAGIDLKADGYICVEPTIHPNGKAYAWEASSDPMEGCMPSSLPGWIRDLVRAPLQAPAMAPSTVLPMPAERRASLQQALGHIPSDDRETWLQVGMAIQNELPTAEGFDLWTQWSQHSSKFNPRDQLRVWRSFEPKGLAGVGVNTVFKMAQLAGWKNAGAVVPQQQQEQPRKGVPMLNLAELEASAAQTTWAIKHTLPANSVGMMFGAPGTFKSFIALDMALHIAHGMQWMGRKTVQAPVIYIAAEGGTGLWRRIKAWHRYRDLSWDAIPLYVVPVAVQIRSNSAAVVAAAEQIGVRPALVVVDTLSQTFDGEENSANDMASYLTSLGAAFRELWMCSVMVIHHSGHGATERPRGSSAILGNTDFLFGVFRDEKQLLATVTCERQKDGELFKDELFELTSQLLGRDEDGDEIRSLTAHHVNPGVEAAAALVRQSTGGRGGRTKQLIDLAENGMPFDSLRKAFYETLGEDMKADAKQKAFVRAWCGAKDMGLLESKEGYVLVSALVDKSEGGEQ